MANLSDTNYVIFNVSELDKVDFNTVLEDSESTVRKSLDGTKTFVNWSGQITPSFVDDMTTKSRIYGYDEILPLLQGPEWTEYLPFEPQQKL